MRKAEVAKKAELTKGKKKYQKALEKTKAKIAALREHLTKERNREQYLRRCISAIDVELGHQKAGQMTFNI